jgi:hypothetical protein
MSIDGATAVVYPVGDPLHHQVEGPHHPTDPPQPTNDA